jgi:hypothetical protein
LPQKAGFAVTEYLSVDAVTQAPHSGYANIIDFAPVPFPSSGYTPDPTFMPDHSTQGQPTLPNGEALRSHGSASSPAFSEDEGRTEHYPGGKRRILQQQPQNLVA